MIFEQIVISVCQPIQQQIMRLK